ncbi:MAG TPA: hypothetical protein VL242_51710 [Sorangium sp.]|nr:hypothetical protein [Sorangium sp.]
MRQPPTQGTCVPGSVVACYTGPAGTSGVGRCAPGTQTCRPGGFGYGPCSGDVTPAQERCATPEDESCDGEPRCAQLPPWARGFGGAGGEEGISIASDASGNYYVSGSFRGTVDFGAGPLTSAGESDIFFLKLDPSGSVLWSKRFGNERGDGGGAVTVDASGNVFLTGVYTYSPSGMGLDLGGCPIPARWARASPAALPRRAKAARAPPGASEPVARARAWSAPPKRVCPSLRQASRRRPVGVLSRHASPRSTGRSRPSPSRRRRSP